LATVYARDNQPTTSRHSLSQKLITTKKINAVKNFNAGKNYANQQCRQRRC